MVGHLPRWVEQTVRMSRDYQFSVHFSETIGSLLIARAARERKTPQSIVEDLVHRELLEELSDEERVRARAEIKLYAVVHDITLRKLETNWGSNVTREVFEEIERDHLPLYERAIDGNGYRGGNPTKSRINKQLGARIRAALGAGVYEQNGSPERGNVSSGLIRTYTKLRRPR
jgi:hypothetical protein